MVSACRPLAAVAVVIALLAGCSPKRIPGTDIKDTRDTRAIVAAIEAYRQAAERRDPKAVLALVSPKYFDDAGTPDPADDVDFGQLQKRLVEDYARLTAVHLEIAIKQIEIDGDHASAFVFYDERYRIKTKTSEIPKQASDIHRMQLVREDDAWHFLSGL